MFRSALLRDYSPRIARIVEREPDGTVASLLPSLNQPIAKSAFMGRELLKCNGWAINNGCFVRWLS